MILVTGASGYLGAELCRLGGAAVVGTSSSLDGVDVRDAAAVGTLVREVRPSAVIHTAYRQHAADARAINVDGAAVVAAAAAGVGARLVHMSSDLVFRGGLGRPLTERDAVDPITDYGREKADAELAVGAAHASALIVRTSLIYGGPAHAAGPSGHERFALEAARGERAAVLFSDELRSPIQVGDLAAALLALCELEVSGPLHVAGADAVDRHELGRLFVAAHGGDPDALRAGLSGPGRPKDCALDSSRAQRLLGDAVRLRGAREVLAGDH